MIHVFLIVDSIQSPIKFDLMSKTSQNFESS
jgi:hypothetical protein